MGVGLLAMTFEMGVPARLLINGGCKGLGGWNSQLVLMMWHSLG